MAVLAKIAAARPAMGRHLHERVTTGAVCRYDPDPADPARWLL